MALNCISTRKPHAEPSRSHDCVQATAGPLRDHYVNTTRNHNPGLIVRSSTHQPAQYLGAHAAMELHVHVHTEDVVGLVAYVLLNRFLDELHPPHRDFLPAAKFRHLDDTHPPARCHGYVCRYSIGLIGENVEVHGQPHLEEGWWKWANVNKSKLMRVCWLMVNG